jgi:hypothetical protein
MYLKLSFFLQKISVYIYMSLVGGRIRRTGVTFSLFTYLLFFLMFQWNLFYSSVNAGFSMELR